MRCISAHAPEQQFINLKATDQSKYNWLCHDMWFYSSQWVCNGLGKYLPLTSTTVFSYDSIDTGESPVSGGPAAAMDQPHVIPSQGDLLGDLLNLDLGPPVNVPQVSSMQMGAVDLLGGGLDSLVSLNTHTFCSWVDALAKLGWRPNKHIPCIRVFVSVGCICCTMVCSGSSKG